MNGFLPIVSSLSLLLVVGSSYAKNHPPTTPRPAPASITQKIHDSKRILIDFHQYDAEPQYIEAEAAYHRAAADLEDYENGDLSISLERVNNDAWELWMDLASYRDSSGVTR